MLNTSDTPILIKNTTEFVKMITSFECKTCIYAADGFRYMYTRVYTLNI